MQCVKREDYAAIGGHGAELGRFQSGTTHNYNSLSRICGRIFLNLRHVEFTDPGDISTTLYIQRAVLLNTWLPDASPVAK